MSNYIVRWVFLRNVCFLYICRNRMALISIAYGITADGEFHKDLTVLHNRISFSFLFCIPETVCPTKV